MRKREQFNVYSGLIFLESEDANEDEIKTRQSREKDNSQMGQSHLKFANIWMVVWNPAPSLARMCVIGVKEITPGAKFPEDSAVQRSIR